MTPAISLAESVRVFVLLCIALGMLVPVVVHSHRVMHTHAIYLSTATISVLAVSVVVQAIQGPGVASESLQVLVSAGVLGTTWLFAREYVNVRDETPLDVELEASGDGFETGSRGDVDE